MNNITKKIKRYMALALLLAAGMIAAGGAAPADGTVIASSAAPSAVGGANA